MAIPSRQIGWGTESNLLWQISKQLEYLSKVTAASSNVTVDNTIANPVPVIGPLTDVQLRASAINVITALPIGASTSALQTTGNTSLSNIDTKTPTLDSLKQPVIPSMTSGGHLSVTTNALGTTFTAFASQVCKQLNVSNQTEVTIEVQQGGSGVAFQIPTGAFYTFFGITNANQLAIRRTDVINTPVTVTARWEV